MLLLEGARIVLVNDIASVLFLLVLTFDVRCSLLPETRLCFNRWLFGLLILFILLQISRHEGRMRLSLLGVVRAMRARDRLLTH